MEEHSEPGKVQIAPPSNVGRWYSQRVKKQVADTAV